MHTSGRLAAVSLSVALLSAVSASSMAAPSEDLRAGNAWTTVGTFGGGKHQACKVVVDEGTKWRVKNRLVNGNQGRVGAGMRVQRDGEATDRAWDSGLVRRGETSPVGSVTFPKGDPDFTLESFEYQSQAGNGGPLEISDIGRC